MKKFIVLSGYFLLYMHTIFTSPSSLDTSFSNNGATTNLFIAQAINEAQSIVVQADGKIVIAGYAGDNAILIRYNSDGSLDTSFNQNGSIPGSITIELGTQTAAYGIAIDPLTQKIVVVGYMTLNGVDTGLIARYNYNGTLDTTFNDVHHNNTGGYIATIFESQSQLFGIAMNLDGSMVVTGWAMVNGLSHALVVKYTNDGFLDTSFNATGYVTTLIGGIFTKARAVTIQPDGKIVITGQADIANTADNQQLIVIRYTSDGVLDTQTFNPSGQYPGSNSPFTDISFASAGYGIALQKDQKIIVVGSANPLHLGFNNQMYTVARFNRDGTLDTTFNATNPGSLGYIFSDLGLQANSVVIQPNNQIVTCGFNYTTSYVTVVIRFNANGSIDPTFNFAINDPTANTLGYAIALQANGKIVVSGTRSITTNE